MNTHPADEFMEEARRMFQMKDIPTIASSLRTLVQRKVRECMKAVCKGCELEWELRRDGVHYRQILMDKREKGEFVYREADKLCLAMPIRSLLPEQEGL